MTLKEPPDLKVPAEPEIDENLTDKDGLRIASEALLRELARYSGQAAITFAIIGVIGYAGYWSLKEMRGLPALLQAVAKPFLPAPAAPPVVKSVPTADSKNSAATRKLAEDKPTSKVPVRKHFRRSARRQIAARTPYKTDNYYPYASEPHGGRIEYSDGVVTQYRWDR